MSKRGVFAATAAVIMVITASQVMAGDKVGAWLDVEHCEICAPILAEKGLFENLELNEQPFATGMIMTCSPKAGYEAAYKRADAKMKEAIGRYMSGEPMRVCGQCASMKALAAAGAKIDELKGGLTSITIVSAQDPKLIDAIHDHVHHTEREMAKLAQR